MNTNKIYEKYIKITLNDLEIYTFKMKVKDLVNISYVAVRGRDHEKGAVQRVLNKKRISSIKDYVLNGNMFVNSFIINWTDQKAKPEMNEEIIIPIINSAAQLIDGQHRLEGLKEAMAVNKSISDNYVLVSMTIGLDTKEAAKIFININSEQKPVPKSLIYDLYGITDDEKNYAIIRADDIAKELNENIESPYYNLIKYPGSPRGKGKIDLSTVVSSLKKHVDTDGKFVDSGIRDLSLQSQFIINYFNAIKYFWDQEDCWNNLSQNVFLKASGFISAIEFFFEYVFPRCVIKRNFKVDYIISMFDFSNNAIILNDDIKGSDGKTSRKLIYENLKSAFKTESPGEEEYEY